MWEECGSRMIDIKDTVEDHENSTPSSDPKMKPVVFLDDNQTTNATDPCMCCK